MNHHRPDWISLTRAEEFPRRRPDDWPAPFTFIELGVDRITVEHDLVEADRITIRAHGPHPEDSGGVELDMDPDAARVLARELQRHAEACLRRDAGHELTLRSIASVAGIPLDDRQEAQLATREPSVQRRTRDVINAGCDWQARWLVHNERQIRLSRLLERLQADATSPWDPYDRVPGARVQGQLSLWHAETIASDEPSTAHLWVRALALVDTESSAAFQLEREARDISITAFDMGLLTEPIESMIGLGREVAERGWAAGIARLLALAVETEAFGMPLVGMCHLCRVVRPLDEFHVFRAGTTNQPLYACMYGMPVRDRFGLAVDDHWGAPCACDCAACAMSLAGDELA